jgi:hypothetical protein
VQGKEVVVYVPSQPAALPALCPETVVFLTSALPDENGDRLNPTTVMQGTIVSWLRYLATAGKKVLVLEKNVAAGGGVVTREVTTPGFRHDMHSAAHQHSSDSQSGTSPSTRVFSKYLRIAGRRPGGLKLETCQKGCRKPRHKVTDSADTTAALQAMLEPQPFHTTLSTFR